jgi:hypothetical protein
MAYLGLRRTNWRALPVAWSAEADRDWADRPAERTSNDAQRISEVQYPPGIAIHSGVTREHASDEADAAGTPGLPQPIAN